jgi:outer membrane protein OmpA-like peptidoglycan-associated protein
MKKTSLSVVFAFVALSLFAQSRERPANLSRWSLGVKAGVNLFRVEPFADIGGFLRNYINQSGLTIPEAFIEYAVTPYLGIGLDGGIFKYNRSTREYGTVTGRTIDATLYGSINLSNILSPQRVGFWNKVNFYGNVGLGGGIFNYAFAGKKFAGKKGRSISPMALLGLNVAFDLGKALELNLEGAYRYYVRNEIGGLPIGGLPNKTFGADAANVTVGLRYKFNANKKTHVRNMQPMEYYPLPNMPVAVQQQPQQPQTVVVPTPTSVETDPAIYDRLKGIENETKVIKDKLQQLEDGLKSLGNQSGGTVTASFQNIEFEFGSYTLTSASKRVLDQITTILKNNPTWESLVIVGHTDNVGTTQVNQKLSEERAKAVSDYLIKSGGIAASKVSTKGFGLDKPIAPNNTAEGRQKNRRVEFEISK